MKKIVLNEKDLNLIYDIAVNEMKELSVGFLMKNLDKTQRSYCFTAALIKHLKSLGLEVELDSSLVRLAVKGE